MLNWIKKHSDLVSSIASITQSLAVLIGLIVLLNEFVWSNEDRERTKHENALNIYHKYSSSESGEGLEPYFSDLFGLADAHEVHTYVHKNLNEIVTELRQTERKYIEIQACLETGSCHAEFMYHLFCADAFFDAYVGYKVFYNNNDDDPRIIRTSKVTDLFVFWSECSANNYSNTNTERASSALSSIKHVVEELDKEFIEKLQKQNEN